MHFSFWQKPIVINGQRFGRCFPLHPPFYNCEELVQEFEKSVKQDGCINLQREGELDWFLWVCYTYDKITRVISCSQEAYIDRLLVKYGMENANACKLQINPGSDLDSLPVLDKPDKIVVHSCAALIGELL